MKTLSFPRVSPQLWLIAVCLAWPVLNGRAEPPEHRLPPLTTAKGSPQIPGKFVWADLITDDAQAARTFYGRLFGWTFREVGGFAQALYAGEEIDFSRRLKRLARRRRLGFVILHRHPLRTSDRKARLYTKREHFAFMLKTVLLAGRTLRDRDACHVWYDGRR